MFHPIESFGLKKYICTSKILNMKQTRYVQSFFTAKMSYNGSNYSLHNYDKLNSTLELFGMKSQV